MAEFSDSNDVGASSFKSWMSRHKHDILASASRPPQTLVTGSYTGELIFWRLETGAAYGMYNIDSPTERITLQYKMDRKKEERESRSLVRQSTLVGKRYFVLQNHVPCDPFGHFQREVTVGK